MRKDLLKTLQSTPTMTQFQEEASASSPGKPDAPVLPKGYYSRPALGGEYDALKNVLGAAEAEAGKRAQEYDWAKKDALAAQESTRLWQKHVEFWEKKYRENPTEATAARYNSVAANMQKMQADYGQAQEKAKTAYDQVVAAGTAYRSAAEKYLQYHIDQQQQYQDWRSTIREGGAIQQELAQMDGEIGALEQEIRNLETLTRFRNDALGQSMRESLARAQAQMQQLQAARALLQEEYDWSQYYHYNNLLQADDFKRKSGYVSTANGLEPQLNALSGMYTETGFDDLTYDYINRNEEARGRALVNSIGDNTALLGLDTSYLEKMNDQEIAIFNYLYATQGADAAYRYTAYLTGDLTKRQRMEQEVMWAEWAKEHPVKSSAFSVLTSPLRGMSYLGQAADLAADGEIDQNAAYNKFSHVPAAIRGEVTRKIEESGKWGSVGSFGYQTAMSMADFLFSTFASGGNAGLAMTIMGSGAAADTTIAARERGVDSGKAFTLGAVAGLAEAVTEKFSLEALLDPKLLKDSVLKYIGKNMLAEGGEEAASSLINLFADIMISGDKSEWQQSIDAYMAQGMSEKEAFMQAFKDQALSITLDALGGAISGGFLGGGNAALQSFRNSRMTKPYDLKNAAKEDVQALIDSGLERGKETESYQLAQQLQKKLDDGKTPSAEELSRLAMANQIAIQEEAAEEAEPEGLQLPKLEDETVAGADPARDLNGGTNYENTQGTQEHAAAETAAGASVLPGSGQRYDGAGTREQAGSLGSRAGQAAAGNWPGADAARKAVRRTNLGADLPKVSSASLGLESGTDVPRVRILPREYWDESMVAKEEQVYNETGKHITYILGNLEFRNSQGGVSTAKGVILDDRIIVQANHHTYTAEQIADHEAFHGMVDEYKQKLINDLSEKIVEKYSEEEFHEVLNKYILALRAVIDVGGAKDPAEYAQRVSQVMEEMLADAHAGMNMWGAGATKYTETVNRFLDENMISRKASQENGTEEPTGPPADRFSYEDQHRLSLPTLDDEAASDYVGRSLINDSEIYTYRFMTAQPPMKPVELPPVTDIRDAQGKIDTAKVVRNGIKNALSVGSERGGRTYVKNRYTGRDLLVTTAAIRHGLNGAANRMLTNARLGSVIGKIVQNAIPINALHDTADGVEGTYAMAGYAFDQRGREFIAIITVEQRTNAVEDITAYDMTHAISGRQKRSSRQEPTASIGGSQADTKSQGINLIKAYSEISIADLLEAVKEVYQSILSNDVLAHMGETRNPEGHYTGRVRYSYAGENANNADLDALARAKEMQAAGVTDETIRQQTGWFRGMDGKWRWEIDDSGMQYTQRGDLGFRERNPGYARYRELLDKSNRYVLELSDEALTDGEQAELKRLSGIWKGTFQKPGRVTEDALPQSRLGDYLKHDALFEAYPMLRDTELRFANLPDGTRGQLDLSKNRITLNENLRRAPEDTLIHEIQHVIQDTEDFAMGSSTEFWDGQEIAKPEYAKAVQEARERVEQAEAAFHREWKDDINLNLVKQYVELDNSFWSENMTPELVQENENQMEQIAQAAEEGGWGDLFDEYYYAVGELQMAIERAKWNRRTSLDLYRNTAGEIEARDAASRRSLTPEQRRATEPAKGDERTVFAEGGRTLSEAIAELDQEYAQLQQTYVDTEFTAQEIRENIQAVAKMDPVADVAGTEFAKGEVDLITQVENFFDSLGNEVHNRRLGDVVLDRRGVKSDIAHGIGRKKAAAFAAVPDVIRDGQVVDYQENWKNRGYDTAVLAAPIRIAGKENIAGVIVIRSRQSNRFYLHEVLATENGALPFKTGALKQGDSGGDAPSIFNILDQIRAVKDQSGKTERFSVEDMDNVDEDASTAQKPRKQTRPVAESKPLIAKRKLRTRLLGYFSIPDGMKAELGSMIDNYADRLIKNGSLTEEDRKHFFDRMYESGVMTVPANDYYAEARSYLKEGRIYVPDSVVADFGDDWQDIRKRAFAAGIYLTRSRTSGNHSVSGIDTWNQDLASEVPGLFNSEETDQRTILERIVQVAEEGRDENMSLSEYTARLAESEQQSEEEFLDNMERELDWALRTFAENADLELQLRDRTGVKIAQEREKSAERMTRQRAKEAQRRADERQARKESAQRAKERRELRELQQRTLKQLQWLSKNRNRAPEELKETWNEVLGDIDLYAVSAANEMRWSEKHQATWKDLAQMYKDAQKNDPNFLPSPELERIVTRLDAAKIEDMDLGALQDLYKAAIGLRTEFYNRNNVINDEMQRIFEEVYADAKKEIEAAPGGYTGKVADKFLNLDQLTPMNVLQRMGGWDPNGAFYSMARQLEKGERDMRAYSVRAQKILADFLTEHEDWMKKADGQGKDAIWYEVEVPQLLELGMGDKPIFGPTVKVYMTPSQKVHMYLESKNLDNLRHMTGGRTFADKELYSQGKRQEALAQGKTIRLAPETVKKLVSDLTPEEMELAKLLDQYYNSFATQEINRISNILYGYDKAMGRNYAPIYTNRNYTKSEFGVFDVTAEGVGNLKGRQFAVNPSYNISAFDAFERHVDQTARFVGMAIPARNWTTLMNWREKNNSTGDVITHKWGEESKKYITDLITTLQAGDSAKSDTISAGISKLQSNYITAIFGANPSIVLKQLGSIPMAGAYLDARNVPTPAQLKNIDRGLISKYTQELEWRTMGYTTPETKQLKDSKNWTQRNKFIRFTLGGGAITAMDGWAASALWPWAENKVRREYPDLEIGTQAQIEAGESPFYKKVAEEFENAITRSQSVSDEIHQGSLRKSKDPVTKAFTMFRSDSAQTYNTLRQKIGEAQYYARTGATEKMQATAKKAVGTAFMAMLLNAMWGESINFLMALWKNKGKYYRDDEDELTTESVFSEMVSGMIGSFAGVVTGGEEVLEVIGNILTGKKIYDIETPGMEQLNDLIEVISTTSNDMRGLVSGGWDILKNGGDLGEYFGKNSGVIRGAVKDLAEAAAMYIPGFPASNLEAYLMGAVKWLSPELGTAYDDLFSNMGKGNLAGLEGGALETRIGGILSDRKISDSDETSKALAALYASGYKTAMPSDTPASVTVKNESHALGAYQQQAYENIWSGIVSDALDDLVASEQFASADPETQAKMLERLYDYAAEHAKAELFDEHEMKTGVENIDLLRDAGLALEECITWTSQVSGMKQAEKFEALRQWDMTDKEKLAVMGTLIGTDMETESGKPSQYAKMLDALNQGMDMNQYLDMRLKGTDVEDYLDLIEEGMDAGVAYEFSNYMEEIEQAADGAYLDDLSRWRASVDFSSDVEDQLAALSMTMDPKALAVWETANSYGVEPDIYVTFQERATKYDSDDNGSYTQAEAKAAIDAEFSHLTTAQKAVLWQWVCYSSGFKKNPYDPAVGQKFIDSREAAKKAAEEDEDEPEGLTLGNW